MPVILTPNILSLNANSLGIGSRHDGDSHEDVDDEGQSEGDVLVAKIVAMLVLGVCTLILGLLPMWLSRRFNWHADGGSGTGRSQMALTLLRALGGGALLATTFLHMIPETREAVEHLQEDGLIADTDFHLPELLVCCGFFIMYTVEELVHSYVHWRERKGAACPADDAAAVHRSLSIRRCSTASQGCPEGAAPARADSAPALQDPKLFLVADAHPARHDECARVHSATHAVPDYGSVLPSKGASDVSVHVHSHGHGHGHGHSHAHGHSHLPPEMGGGGGGAAAGLRGLLIVLALSVHELFEGLAVGLQTTAAYVYYLMGAVAAHKLVLAFCVGLEMVAAGTRTRLAVLYVLVFAAVSPVGISVGIALSGDTAAGADAEHSVANSVLQGLAAGTLLYVVFFEVLQRERAVAAGIGLRQLLAVAIGFAVMFGLLAITGHEHNHGDGDGHNH